MDVMGTFHVDKRSFALYIAYVPQQGNILLRCYHATKSKREGMSVITRRLAVAIIFMFIAVFAATSAWGAVVYVKQDSPGPVFDGKSWGTAFHKVQDGVNAADTYNDDVWVAAGTYIENINISKFISLYGGFAGTEASKEDRDWLRNPTVLDGNRAGSVINYYPNHVALKVDGFTIRNGSAYYGGGIQGNRNNGTGYPDMLTVVHCKLIDNTALGDGGAIYTAYMAEIVGCTIQNNKAIAGGGIYTGYHSTFRDSVIESNIATGNGGGVYSPQGGIVERCVFKGNRAAEGGAFYASNSVAGSFLRVDIRESKFAQNAATGNSSVYPTIPSQGGAVYAKSTAPAAYEHGWDVEIANCFFNGNTAADSGSAAYLEQVGVLVHNSSLAKNGMASEGAINLEMCKTLFINNIVAFNTSGIKWNGYYLDYYSNCAYQNMAYDISGADPTTYQYNISADPRFADVLSGNLHIQPDSPCRDTGGGASQPPLYSDIDGHARVLGGRIDIGADETNGIVWGQSQVGVVYVSPSGNDLNDGSSWAKAKKSIQAGIEAAAGEVAEVWVAAGTYSERITLKPNAWLYGGFAGTETDKSQRDWKASKTVIDGTPAQGQQGGSVVTIVGIAANLSCFDGFTVHGGAGTSKPSSSDPGVSYTYGGGIYCECSAVEILNCAITGNKSDIGGGMYCVRSNALINRCKFIGNDAYKVQQNTNYGNGGALYCVGSCVVSGNIFSRNIANHGSAIYCSGQTKIAFNTVVQNGGYTDSAIYCADGLPLISSNIIAFNGTGIQCNTGYPTIKDNCVYSNLRYNHKSGNEIILPNSDISVDPKLVSLDYGDFHIQPDSPCIGKGDNTFAGAIDIDGQPRVGGERADIGADESDGIVREVNPTIIRVSSYRNSNDDYDGSSWQKAKRSIQAAVNALRDTGGEVWVATGTYYTTGSVFGPVSVPSYVHIYGGFNGTETQRIQRNWNTNIAKITQYGTLYVNDSMIKFEPNCAGATLDGFTVTDAKVSQKCGGIYCSYGSKPLIYNNRITNNTLQVSTAAGSGIYGEAECYPTIANNLITKNTAANGASIYLLSSGLIIGNTIADNNGDGAYGSCYPISSSATYSAIYQNNIIAFNTGKSLTAFDINASGYNCVFGNGTDIGYAGDIRTDPMFVDRADGDYHLAANSPCIDAGINALAASYPFDMDGESRMVFGVDMGADECQVSYPITAENRLQPINTKIRFSGIVTYASDYICCVELPDRSGAIMVRTYRPGVRLHVDDKVEVSGKMTADTNYAKNVDASYVAVVGSGHIEPFLIPNRFIGGGNLAYEPFFKGGLPGVKNGIGTNNLFLLIRTTGRVTAREDYSANLYSYIYVDDGSGVVDYEGKTGIRAIIPIDCTAPVGSYVSVTGICESRLSDSIYYRQIRARSADDVVVLQP